MRGGRPYGTAFVVELEAPKAGQPSRYAALTCERVVREAGLGRGDGGHLTLVSLAEGQPDFEASVSWDDVHEEADLALLHFEPGLDLRRSPLKPLLVALDDRATGHDVCTHGFAAPGRGEGGPARAGGRAAPPEGRWGYGRAAGLVGNHDRRRLQLRDCAMPAGAFGGAPAIDLSTRRVVALLSEVTRPEGSGRGGSEAMGVPASVLRAKLPALRRRPERPYQGLDRFTEADERYWVDPSGLRTKVLARLDASQRFVAVIGPAGVGKSSLLSAGLLPRLRERAARWGADVGSVRLDRERALEMASACQRHLERPAPEGPDLGGAKQALYDLLLGWAGRRAPAAAAPDPATRPASVPPGAAGAVPASRATPSVPPAGPASRTSPSVPPAGPASRASPSVPPAGVATPPGGISGAAARANPALMGGAAATTSYLGVAATGAATLANLGAATGRGLVMLLDQFEELLLIDEASCRQVARTLVSSLQEGWGGGEGARPDVHLVIALRESFLGQLGEWAPELKRLVSRAAESVPLVIDEERLRDVIEKPAAAAEQPWGDRAFVAALLAAAKGDYATESGRGVRASVLPTLQIALARAWDAREADSERPAAPVGHAPAGPEAPGGPESRRARFAGELHGALGQVLDGVVARLARRRRAGGAEAPGDAIYRQTEALVAQLLARFVRPESGSTSGAPKGRPRRLSELKASLEHLAPPAALEIVARELVLSRVLSARAAGGERDDDLSLELVHDTLLRSWAPLEGPSKRVLAFMAWHAALAERARLLPRGPAASSTWQATLWGEPGGPLLSGYELEAALDWRRERSPDIAPEVRALIEQSEWHRRAARRLGAVAVGAFALVAFGVTHREHRVKIEAAVSDVERARNRLAAERKHASELRASMAEATQYEVRALGQEPRALADAVRSSECAEQIADPEARAAITGALLRSLLAFRVRAPFDTAGEVPYRVALTEDGREAVLQWLDDSGETERFELWDTRTGSKLRPLGRREHCWPAVAGPDTLRWVCGPEGKDRHSLAFLVGAERALSWSAPENRALVRSAPNELWLSRGKGKGAERIRLDDGAPAGELAPSLSVTSLDRSADGSTVALGTEEDRLLLWDAKGETVTALAHAGPVLQAAVAAGGAGALTLGPMTTCRYVAGKERRCNGIEGPIERGAVAIDDTGAVAALATQPPLTSPVRPLLLVTAGDRVYRYNEGWAALDLDVSVGQHAPSPDQVPKAYATLRGLSTSSSRQEPARFELRFDVGAPPRRDQPPRLAKGPLSYEGFEKVQLGGDGAWRRDLPGAERSCAEGSFRRTAACAGTQIVAHGGQWFRVSDGHPGAPAGRRVLAYSSARRVALVDAGGALELRRVEPGGLGEPLPGQACRPRTPPVPSRDDPARSFAAACEGGNDLVVVRDTAGGPTLQTLSARPPGAPAGALSQALRDGDVVVTRSGGEHLGRAELSSAGLLWAAPGAHASFSAEARGEGFWVLRSHRPAPTMVEIYVGPNHVRTLDHESIGLAVEAVPTKAGPLLWLSHPTRRAGIFLEASGNEISVAGPESTGPGATRGPSGELVLEGAPASGAVASPDGRWVLLRRSDAASPPPQRAPALLRIDGGSKGLVFDSLLPLPGGGEGPPAEPSFFWLPPGPKGSPRLLVARGPNLWAAERDAAGTWALRPLADLPAGAEGQGLQAVPSPNGGFVALSFRRPGWSPAHGIELRDGLSLDALGTIAAGSPTPPWFVDEEHLLLSEPMQIVSLRPDELRREACDLLRSRGEFASVKGVCEHPPSRCEPAAR